MDDKDPPPFGYTFNSDPFETQPHPFDTSGPSLLSDMENQSLADFFSNTDPFLNNGPSAFAPSQPKADGTDDFADWNLSFVPPATIHQVSTTIPDQPQFTHGFHPDQTFAQQPLSSAHMNNTQDDLQAASTLFSNAQSSHANGRSYSFPNLPTRHTPTTTYDDGNHAKPMVITAHGLINEQLAALLPNHGEDGSIDAQLATQWATSNAAQRHEEEFGDLLGRTPIKRTFSFGTDSAFNSTGYMAPSNQESEEHVTNRLIREMVRAQPLLRTAPNPDGSNGQSPTGHVHFPPLSGVTSDDDGPSEETSDEGDDVNGPAKKRRKSKHTMPTKGTNGSPRKSLSAGRPGKARKSSVDEQGLKKKRPSAAGQKVHRENLTEEQKRNNHILSEQKRRNLIKRGFDDLHDLVPEIRNGGLSKSSVLTEAANFLEKLIQDNNQFFRLIGVEG